MTSSRPQRKPLENPQPAKPTWGGARSGSGRPMRDTIEIRTEVTTISYQKLNRLAIKLGLVRHTGSKQAFFGGVINHLLLKIETEEPEYMRLAREINAAAH